MVQESTSSRRQNSAVTTFPGTYQGGNQIGQLNADTVNFHHHEADDSLRKFRHWLSSIQYNERHNELRDQRKDGTAGWILDNRSFVTWQNDGGGFLWLSGPVGSGKSILASEVIEEMKRRTTVAYFYCDFTRGETMNELVIFRSLLSQTLSYKHYIPGLQRIEQDMFRQYKHNFGSFFWTDYKNYLLAASKECAGITIIIDGLDECEEDRVKILIAHTKELSTESKEKGPNGHVRVLLSCRPVKQIETHLKGFPHLCISLEREIHNISKDMQTYVESEFKYTDFSKRTRETVWKQFESKGVRFQLVQSQMRTIKDCENEEQVLGALQHLPAELRDEYQRMLHKLKISNTETDIERAKKTFLLLITAKRPLFKSELAEALGFDERSTRLDQVTHITNFNVIIRACGSFLKYRSHTIDDYEVSLSHFSVKEYFLSTDPVPDFQFLHLESERKLAVMTLSYLTLDDFEHPPCRTSETFSQRLKEARLLKYCAKHWTDHVYSVMDEEPNEEVQGTECTSNEQESSLFSQFVQTAINYLTMGMLKQDYTDDVMAETHQQLYQLIDRLLLQSKNKRNNFVQVRHALDSHAPMTTFDDYDPDLCPVFYPVYCGLLGVTRRFIQANPQWANEEMKYVGTPLMVAVSRDDGRMVRLLVEQLQSDKNKPCALRLWEHIYPLYYAAYMGHEKAFDELLRCGAVVTIRAKFHGDGEDTSGLGTPVLHTAAYWGRTSIVKSLLRVPQLGVDQPDENGASPLFSAVEGCHLDVVRLLVEHGCDIAIRSNSGKTAVHTALELRDEELVKYFLTRIEDGTPFLRTFLPNELAWAHEKDWYQRALKAFPQGESRTQEPFPLSTADALQLIWILQKQMKLPGQISSTILDLAELWTSKIVRRSDPIVVDPRSPQEPYLRIVAHGSLRRITVCTVSHDQGWTSDGHELSGGYAGSFTFFDLGLTRTAADAPENNQDDIRRKRIQIQRNVRACSSSRMHLNDFDWRNEGLMGEKQKWFAAIRPGDELGIFPRAMYPGWQNYVQKVEIKIWCVIE